MIERVTVDNELLPDALLSTVKAHTRVEHTRDDELLKVYTAASISLVERKCNVSLNPATYVVTRDELRYGRGLKPGWWLPLNNVHAFAADNGGVDISADYLLGNADFGGNTSSYLYPVNTSGCGTSLPFGALVTLEVGVDDPAVLAPGFLTAILRLTASMYENREAASGLAGDGFDSELMALWRPDA
jgi:uncharacterized phiE125 gp8 family phage protein